jgi:molecular chaperone GrpE
MTDSTARRADDAAAKAGKPAKSAEDAAPDTVAMQADQAPSAEADPVAELTRQNADLKDKLLRTLAEMENLRKRTEREVADARTYGVASFARDSLGIADNLRRALDAVGPEMRETADAATTALIDGVELIERELLKTLERNGVKKFDPTGQKFDPNVHQAMYEVPDETVPAGTVAQTIQAGYMIGDRMLRPALVAVTKGGARQGAKQGAGQRLANDNRSDEPPADPNGV